MKKHASLTFLLLISIWQFLPAQNVELISFGDFHSRVQQHSDSVIVYNFWATWCRPCVKEMPYFLKLNEDYASRKLRVVLVSVDFQDMKGRVTSFVQSKGYDAEVLLIDEKDPNEWIDKISTQWSGAIPATLITYKGKKAFKEQSFTYDELSTWVESVMD